MRPGPEDTNIQPYWVITMILTNDPEGLLSSILYLY